MTDMLAARRRRRATTVPEPLPQPFEELTLEQVMTRLGWTHVRTGDRYHELYDVYDNRADLVGTLMSAKEAWALLSERGLVILKPDTGRHQ